jgi:hypothetical protein
MSKSRQQTGGCCKRGLCDRVYRRCRSLFAMRSGIEAILNPVVVALERRTAE